MPTRIVTVFGATGNQGTAVVDPTTLFHALL